MRLLERNSAGEILLTKFFIDNPPPYAILSHTWGTEEDEVSLNDLADGTGKNKLGYDKIRFCGDQAWRDGLRFFWVDTCCIDKPNNTELQEAINSMFRWYRDAAKCYVYLADVSIPTIDADDNSGQPPWESAFRKSRWFTRGWTLQELIAPTSVDFFSKEGVCLGNRTSLEQLIHDITGIPLQALRGSPLSDFSVSERMLWIGKRETTRKEDKAYSLLGIFDVQMPLIYGEGERSSFRRLREEINKVLKPEQTYHQTQLDDQSRKCLEDLRLSDPRVDIKRIEATKGGLFRGASNWILYHDDFQRWRRCDDARLLWIKGDPGKGKTMLLITIVDELERQLKQSNQSQQTSSGTTALSYFFCQGTNKDLNSSTAVLRGLVYLLAVQHPPLISHLRASYDHAGSKLFDGANSFFELSKVLESMLQDQTLARAYLVVDALDECMTDQEMLLKLIVYHAAASPQVKWIVSSRNTPGIEKHLRVDSSGMKLGLEITENAEQVSRAVDTYVDFKISKIQSLQDDDSLRSRVRDTMREKANGTFLWVALVAKELEKAEGWDVLDVVEEMPPTLGELYDRMMEQIRGLDRKNPEFCRLVLSAATLAYRPLHLAELAVVSRLPKNISANTEYVRKVVSLCGSFLTVQDDDFVYFIHQSAKDYLSDKATTAVFPTGRAEVHRRILLQSLQAMQETLKRDMYGLRHPGFSIDNLKVPDPDPLASIRYASVHWIDHLYEAQYRDYVVDGGVVHKFLERCLLYWIEALGLFQEISDAVFATAKLERLLKASLMLSNIYISLM